MAELLEDVSRIVQEMDDLNQQVREIGLHTALNRLGQAASAVGNSWSKSWLGYQANVYYKDFREPGKGAYFDKRAGLRTQGTRFNDTSGDWVEYDPQIIIDKIYDRGGNPDMDPFAAFKTEADKSFQTARRNLLSIIDIEMSQRESQFLVDMKDELSKLSTETLTEAIARWRPSSRRTSDLEATQQGIKTPPHVRVRARIQAIRSTAEVVQNLAEIGRQIEFHISRQHNYMQKVGPSGTKVFVGHGHSEIWRELKEFLTERLSLEVDEFNMISTAGIPTSTRLEAMLDSAGFAFLVMTAEDEQSDGRFRARENVVHEAGLFQGRLGFRKAIVLLEEGCEEFSNIHGLGHIPFLKRDFRAASEEIRRVLEREGLLNR